MKTSPPSMFSSAWSTRSTACGSVIQKRVMRSSVIVIRPSRSSCSRNTGHDRTARADDVAVPHARQAGLALRGVGVALHEDLLGAELGRAVEVDRVHGLVGRERDDLVGRGRRSRRRRRVVRRARWCAPLRTGCTRTRGPASSRRRARRCRRLRPRGSCGPGRGRRRSGSGPGRRRSLSRISDCFSSSREYTRTTASGQHSVTARRMRCRTSRSRR